MTKVDEPMPSVALETVLSHKQENETHTTTERLTGIQWLRERLEGRYGICDEHSHAECTECHSVKCVGDDYHQYEEIQQVCDCNHESVTHRIVPFDNFGQHVGFY